MIRFNGQALRSARLDGKAAKVARLNGEVVWTSGLRSIEEEWGSIDSSVWRTMSDPASIPAYPYVSGGVLYPGIPTGLYSGRPAQSVYTREEADNATGVWTVRVWTTNSTAGLFSGVILGADAASGRLAEVVWDKNEIRFRYRTAMTNSWVTLGSTAVTISGGEVMRVERVLVSGSYRVRVYENDVLRGNWLDSSRIPGLPRGKFIGVRVQGDINLFTHLRSPAIAEFTFAAT